MLSHHEFFTTQLTLGVNWHDYEVILLRSPTDDDNFHRI